MFKVACIQICSNNDIKENLDKVLTFVKQSISNGAEFILTPEVTSLFFSNKLDLLSKISTMQEDIFVKEFKKICNINSSSHIRSASINILAIDS